MKTAVLLYPHQLFPLERLPKADAVIMIEDPLFFGVDQELPAKLHKQKIILHRASMRRYAKEVLWPNDIDVEYIECGSLFSSAEIFDRASKYQKLFVFDPVHEVLTRRLLEARRNSSNAPELEFLPSPHFLLKDQEVREYFHETHKSVFSDFYKWQRERFNVLITDEYKPEGGKWEFATEASKLQKDHKLPSFQSFGNNEFVDEAIRYTEERFGDNPGSTDFIWPTNHDEARTWLDGFIAERLAQYGPYHETFSSDAPWLYHSALSSSINIGLISPSELIDVVVAYYKKHDLPLESAELFIRNILGWREFMRGFYITKHTQLKNSNPFKQHRRLTAAWWNGTLGIQPYDDIVKKVNKHGYAHHTERLTVLQNLMILAEIHPEDIHKFFSHMFVDAHEWVVVPSTFGSGVNIDGHAISDAPLIAPASQLLKQSTYERELWVDVWDGLYWRFVEKHKGILLNNPSTRAIAQRLERLDADHRRIIGYRAEDFLKQYTLL